MDKLKRIGRALLFPHMSIMLVLLIISTVFLTYSMVFLNQKSPAAIGSYVLAAYTLTTWCVRIPRIIVVCKSLKNENKYVRMWLDDVHLRMKVSLYGSFIWNTSYAVFQLCLGGYHSSFWYYSMAAYYIILAGMRFYLSLHTRKHKPGDSMRAELVRYRTCGIIFLAMNLVLSVIIFFMVYWNRTFNHHEITTIAIATYTFTAFTFAIINIIRYRKYNSPVFSASKAISLAAACLSMLTLTSTMLTTFGEADVLVFRRLMLGLLGGVISIFIITMAIYMIVHAGKAVKGLDNSTSEI